MYSGLFLLVEDLSSSLVVQGLGVVLGWSVCFLFPFLEGVACLPLPGGSVATTGARGRACVSGCRSTHSWPSVSNTLGLEEVGCCHCSTLGLPSMVKFGPLCAGNMVVEPILELGRI